jgi:hypothetical protein
VLHIRVDNPDNENPWLQVYVAVDPSSVTRPFNGGTGDLHAESLLDKYF